MRCFTFKMGGLLLLLAVFLLVIGGCGEPPSAVPTAPAPTLPPPSPEQPLPTPQPEPGINRTSSATTTSVQLTAQAISFDKSVITVPAGTLVSLVFTNNENPVIFHNVAIYKSKAAIESIMVGEFLSGGEKTTYQFTAPSTPGTYYLRCDVHPLVMIGEFVVQ